MKDIKYNIKRVIAVLSRSETSDWVKALTEIEWSGKGGFKYDIRNWNIEYLNVGENIIDTSNGYVKAFSKGITLTEDEIISMKEIELCAVDNTYTEVVDDTPSLSDNFEPYVPEKMDDRIDLLFNRKRDRILRRTK